MMRYPTDAGVAEADERLVTDEQIREELREALALLGQPMPQSCR